MAPPILERYCPGDDLTIRLGSPGDVVEPLYAREGNTGNWIEILWRPAHDMIDLLCARTFMTRMTRNKNEKPVKNVENSKLSKT